MTGAITAEAGLVPPEDWRSAARTILDSRARRILVLGPRDAGKSSFCRFLLSEAWSSGREAALLDTDPGQKMVGPPACVTLGRRDAKAAICLARIAFLGAVDPLRGWGPLLAGAARLADAVEKGLLVANTGGLLRRAGRRLKATKIAALRPGLLVAIGDDPDLEAILSDHAAIPALRLRRPPLARRKGDGERREARRAAFRHYFTGEACHAVPAERFGAVPGLPPGGRALLSLLDAAGEEIGLGLLRPGEDGGAVLRTPVAPDAIAGPGRGGLWLDNDWDAHPLVTSGMERPP